MRKEKADDQMRYNLMDAANKQLRENQLRLREINQGLQVPQLVSTATTTTTTVTTMTTRPMMGTGYSVGLPPTIQSAATLFSSHNVPRCSSQVQSIQGYSGPSVPDLRKDKEVSSIAEQVMARIYQVIPALAPVPSANVPSSTPDLPVSSGLGVSSGIQQNESIFALQQQAEQLKISAEQQLQQIRLIQQGQQHQRPQVGLQQPQLGLQQAQFGGLQQPQLGLQQPQFGGLQQSHMGGQSSYQERVNQAPTQDPISQVFASDVSLDSLFSMHIKNKQYKAHDFAQIGNFPYCSQIKPANMNLALYGYGSIKHLLALADGTLPSCDHVEYVARLQHIMNVFEMVCLGSKINEFDSHAWKVGREYDAKIVKDIEMGYKNWATLD